jgi:uncharacterized membrane protein YwaF
MAQPPPQGPRRPPPDPSNGDHRGNGWPIAACCIPMLAGAVALVLAHRAGVVFLILFASCTALVALVMADISRLHWRHIRHQRVPARRFPSR